MQGQAFIYNRLHIELFLAELGKERIGRVTDKKQTKLERDRTAEFRVFCLRP